MSTSTTDAPAIKRAPKRLVRGGKQLRDGRHVYWWVEVISILAFYMVYSAIRNINQGDDPVALHHARQLMHWQHLFGLNHEATLQQWAMHFQPLIVTMNYVYGSLHFVVTIGVAIFLYRKWPNDYPMWRNALAFTTALALIGFILWPLMPPRWLPSFDSHFHFVDTLAKYPTLWSFNSGAMNKISNQYAAMPSLHCAWALWCACAAAPRLRRVWGKVLLALYPALTVAAIVLTGNHYFLDAAGGFLIFGVGYTLARIFTRAGRTSTLASVG